MYTVYQVVLVAEDGEYVKSEWQTRNRADEEAAKLDADCGDGQRYIVRDFSRNF